MTNEITNVNSQELINQSRQLAGISGNYMPFIPIITINNQKTEKEIEVDGAVTKVEVPAKKGFNLTTKDQHSNDYITEFYAETLEAVILRIRYSIASKRNVEPAFYSREFDRFDDVITVNDENRNVMIKDTYQNIKNFFATGEKNTLGKPKSAFNLQVILYVDINNEIYRLRLNNASRSNLFNYLRTFGPNDVYTAYKTKFNLSFNEQGQIKFWYVDFERGSSVDLAKEIPLQKELQNYFNVETEVKNKTFAESNEEVIEIDSSGDVIEDKDTINVTQIPF